MATVTTAFKFIADKLKNVFYISCQKCSKVIFDSFTLLKMINQSVFLPCMKSILSILKMKTMALTHKAMDYFDL